MTDASHQSGGERKNMNLLAEMYVVVVEQDLDIVRWPTQEQAAERARKMNPCYESVVCKLVPVSVDAVTITFTKAQAENVKDILREHANTYMANQYGQLFKFPELAILEDALK